MNSIGGCTSANVCGSSSADVCGYSSAVMCVDVAREWGAQFETAFILGVM